MTCTAHSDNPPLSPFSVTELPVDCPSFPSEVYLDPGASTYTLSFGPSDVTVTSGITYFPHDGSYDVTISPSNVLDVGTHTITTVISDGELEKTCVSTITVIGMAIYAGTL